MKGLPAVFTKSSTGVARPPHVHRQQVNGAIEQVPAEPHPGFDRFCRERYKRTPLLHWLSTPLDKVFSRPIFLLFNI